MAISTPQVYNDFSGLHSLKAKARDDQSAAIDEVAAQFESLFVQMMMKSMREASLGEGLFDSKQSEFYRDMYDEQMSLNLSERGGIGLADALKRQLGGGHHIGNMDKTFAEYASAPVAMPAPLITLSPEQHDIAKIMAVKPVDEAASKIPSKVANKKLGDDLGNTPESFIQNLWPAAKKAAEKMAIAPDALIAQAALETGWGKHVMHDRFGENSHNLFGIKADQRWQGDKVGVNTQEYRDGVALTIKADFRHYDSYEKSFDDYVDFVSGNPRYQKAMDASGNSARYFEELQKAGYATDPNYAKKIQSILQSPQMQSVRQANAADTTLGGSRSS